jgi:flagellin-like hook-associated protein FlgL
MVIKGTNNDDAASVTLSRKANEREKSLEQAERKLSVASSYVNSAQNVASEINSLLSKAIDISAKLSNSLPPNTQEQLAQEAKSLLDEINTITSNATYNDESIINAGQKQISINLNPTDNSSGSSFTVNVHSVALSVNDLGIADITASDFITSPSTVITTLESAKQIVSNQQTLLNDSEGQIHNIISQAGLESYVKTNDEKEFYDIINEDKRIEDKIENINNQILQNTQDFDAFQVEVLLSGLKPIPATQTDEQRLEPNNLFLNVIDSP